MSLNLRSISMSDLHPTNAVAGPNEAHENDVVIEIKDEEEKLKDIEAPPPTQTGGTSLLTKYKRKLRRFSKSGIKQELRRMDRMNEEKNYELEIKMLEKNKIKDDMKGFIIGCEHSAHTFIIPHHIMIYIVEYLGEGVPVEAIGFDENSPKFIKHWEQVQIKMFAGKRGSYPRGAPLTKIKTFTGSNYNDNRPGPKACFIPSYTYSQGLFYFADVNYCLAENSSYVRFVKTLPQLQMQLKYFLSFYYKNSKYNKSKSDNADNQFKYAANLYYKNSKYNKSKSDNADNQFKYAAARKIVNKNLNDCELYCYPKMTGTISQLQKEHKFVGKR
jgi:hypothetical protein